MNLGSWLAPLPDNELRVVVPCHGRSCLSDGLRHLREQLLHDTALAAHHHALAKVGGDVHRHHLQQVKGQDLLGGMFTATTCSRLIVRTC